VRLAALVFAVFLASGAALLAVTVAVWQGRTGGAMHAPAGSLLHPAVGVTQHSSDRRQLLIASGIAFAIMAGASLAVGWLVAGRFLRPLRTITATTREISATNLHERLNLVGPDDELKELGDTFDELLARLERSFEFERQFVANASHELRTPLATMRASLDVAMSKPGPIPPQFGTLAERLRREFDHVDRLLESLLILAHAQHSPARRRVHDPARRPRRPRRPRLLGDRAPLRRGLVDEDHRQPRRMPRSMCPRQCDAALPDGRERDR